MDLKKQIKAGNGQAELKTVSGGMLTVAMQGKNIVLKDEKGGMSTINIPNVSQSNGVIRSRHSRVAQLALLFLKAFCKQRPLAFLVISKSAGTFVGSGTMMCTLATHPTMQLQSERCLRSYLEGKR